MLIPTEISRISKLCDTDSFRFAFGGVKVQRTESGPVAVATDGKRLIACRWVEPNPDEYPKGFDTNPVEGFETIVPAKQWNEAMKLPPKKSRKEIVKNLVLEESGCNGTVTLCATDLETDRKITAKVVEGRFTSWQACFPKLEKFQFVEYKLDADMVKEILDIIPKNQENRVTLLVPLDNSFGLTIKAETESYIKSEAVVMPVLSEKEEYRGSYSIRHSDAKERFFEEFKESNGLLEAALEFMTPDQIDAFSEHLKK